MFISILSGAFVFASDLLRTFDSHCEIGFVKLKSYQGTRSSGDVQTVMGLDKSLKDRHLVVVEDIVVGDYIIIHAGYALQKLDQREAERTLAMFAEITTLINNDIS